MSYKNISDQRTASKKHYLENKEKYLERNKRYRNSIRQYVQSIKENALCADCGENYPYYVMDFDHISDKEFDINFLTATGRIGAIKREILKCQIVCSNCHRIRTFERKELLCTRSSAD